MSSESVKTHAEMAMDTLVNLADNAEDPTIRLRAAELILQYSRSPEPSAAAVPASA